MGFDIKAAAEVFRSKIEAAGYKLELSPRPTKDNATEYEIAVAPGRALYAKVTTTKDGPTYDVTSYKDDQMNGPMGMRDLNEAIESIQQLAK